MTTKTIEHWSSRSVQPQKTGEVAFYPGAYDDRPVPEGYAFQPFVATGYGSQESPEHDEVTSVVYAYNNDPHGEKDRKMHVLYTGTSPQARQARDEMHSLEQRLLPLHPKTIGTSSYLQGPLGGVPAETGLVIALGNRWIGRFGARPGVPIQDGNDAKLYVAGFDKAAQLYSEDLRACHLSDVPTSRLARKEISTGHGNVFQEPETEIPAMLLSAGEATDTAAIKRALEMRSLNINAGHQSGTALVRESAPELMNRLLNRYVQVIGNRMLPRDRTGSANVTMTDDITKSAYPVFSIRGIAPVGQATGDPIRFKKPLQVRLLPDEEGHVTQWRLETVEEEPNNRFRKTRRTLAEGQLTEKGLTALFEHLGRQSFEHDTQAKPDVAASKAGRLYTAMVEAASAGMLAAETDIGLKRATLTHYREINSLPEMPQEYALAEEPPTGRGR